MGKVIDFCAFQRERQLVVLNVGKPFLDVIKENLSPEDFLDFQDAMNDDEAFQEADEDIQDLVEGYLNRVQA